MIKNGKGGENMRSEDLKASVITVALMICILGMTICLTIMSNVQSGIMSQERIKLKEIEANCIIKN